AVEEVAITLRVMSPKRCAQRQPMERRGLITQSVMATRHHSAALGLHGGCDVAFHDTTDPPGSSSMMTLIFGTMLPWLLIAGGTWLAYQLVCQNGRILLRLEAIEKRLSPRGGEKPQEAGGLPVGALAPDFELPDLTGGRHKLSEFRGKELLLIFFNPNCGFCTKMAADLAALPADSGDGRAVPIVVTTGDADENRKLVDQHGIQCIVLRQQQMEVASKYRAPGTPMGYRIDKA